MLVDPVVVQLATASGFSAAAIAVGGFIAHARSAIAGKPDSVLRKRTAAGGLCGLAAALLAIAGSLASIW